jgi:hypothetical protein
MYWMRQRSPLTRTLVYAAVATLAFLLASGMGAMFAVAFRGDLSLLGGGEPQALDGREEVTQAQEEDDATKQREKIARQEPVAKDKEAAAEKQRVAARRDEAQYAGTVGDIQARAVGAFRESHPKLLRYDALTAADVEAMQANKTALEALNRQTADLAPPRKYEEQYEVFSAAIDELHEATRLAYAMAADPVAAAELGFDEYDGHVNKAAGLLQRSNELLNREYETIENVREVSPEF